jgi:hypothetical protein
MKRALLAPAFLSLWLPVAGRSELLTNNLPVEASHRGAVPTFVSGQARFQVLAPTLVRLEYSPEGGFVDMPSVSVVNRNDWPQTPAQTHEDQGWFILRTRTLNVYYKLNSGRFTNTNLRIEWQDNTGSHQWKPGDADDRNLGGVPASLDNRSTKAVTEQIGRAHV